MKTFKCVKCKHEMSFEGFEDFKNIPCVKCGEISVLLKEKEAHSSVSSAGLCPHCGYNVFSDIDPFAGCQGKGWYIICPDCIACGPIAETKTEAERLFRKRA